MDEPAKPLGPIRTAHLFPKIEGLLIDLLRALSPEDWEKQTISPQWKVKDVAAHLLDTHLRKLSIARDGHVGEAVVIRSPADLVAFVNRLNEEGVRLYRRLSPPVLISMMELASQESAEYHQSLDPFAPAKFAVSWAGDTASPNWFDTAREFTERWHHQQQIRLALNRPGIMTRELYHPVLDCFMRGLPHAYRDLQAEPGTLLQFEIAGECGGAWYLHRGPESWRLVDRFLGQATSQVIIPQEIAWRIFTKGIDRQAAAAQVQIIGDLRLGSHVLQMTAIVG
ncbi:MAG: maleylpyruvate isomerase N-terminal domain-containing protein [Acidobacteriia bacterium]|nr:maleylpyruvate isomerase N-terminal domain-containing protein [Terriglobia bacterium]